MQIKNTVKSWGSLSKALHWLSAGLIVALIGLGLGMTRLFEDDLLTKFELYQLHKSLGFTLLALVALRAGWRLFQRVKPQALSTGRWEKRLASGAHFLLYAAMVVMPISGWLMVSSSPFQVPTLYFGLFSIPHLAEPSQSFYQLVSGIHEISAYILISLIALHIGAALRHHFVLRDDVLRRMLPGHHA